MEEFIADGLFLVEMVTNGVSFHRRFLIRKLRGVNHPTRYFGVLINQQGFHVLPSAPE